LATIARWDLPIKIILLNNRGHGMCRQTQRQWLGGSYPGTSVDGGLGFPNWRSVFPSFGTALSPIHCAADLDELFHARMFGAYVVDIHPDAQLIPQAKYGQPLEDADPLLPWEELCEQMLISPLPRS
jgi:acetolactate synthase-1/2/3 large subunit